MAKIKRKVEDKRNEMEEMEKVVLTLYKAEVNLKKKMGKWVCINRSKWKRSERKPNQEVMISMK